MSGDGSDIQVPLLKYNDCSSGSLQTRELERTIGLSGTNFVSVVLSMTCHQEANETSAMMRTTGGIENGFRFVISVSRFKTIHSITYISLAKTVVEVDSDNGRPRPTGKINPLTDLSGRPSACLCNKFPLHRTSLPSWP